MSGAGETGPPPRRRRAYLRWLVIYVWLPEVFLALLFPEVVRRRRGLWLKLSALALLIGVPWDLAGLRTGAWRLGRGRLLGLSLVGLPLEEWLFIATVPWLLAAASLITLRAEDAGKAFLSRTRSGLWRRAACGHPADRQT